MTVAFQFAAVTPDDFDALVVLRITVMRDSLERLGRFDPQRAAARFLSTFRPADMRHIVVDGVRAGCVAFWAEPPQAMRVEHFYLATPFQRRGLGGAVLARLFATAPAGTRLFRVGALRDSDANRFYQRHGFAKVGEDEWDIAYERGLELPSAPADRAPPPTP